MRELRHVAVYRYVLKNLMRDWGPEGAAERSQSYGRIVAELKKRLLPADAKLPLANPPKVLVPGAGLGRLCVDIAALGLEAQAPPPPPPLPLSYPVSAALTAAMLDVVRNGSVSSRGPCAWCWPGLGYLCYDSIIDAAALGLASQSPTPLPSLSAPLFNSQGWMSWLLQRSMFSN